MSKKKIDTGKKGGAKSSYELKGRIWVSGQEGTFVGYGRAVLLERIRDCGSISGAAKSMKMSYRHAWRLVDSMNRQAGTPLVETATGGARGGGARLTKAGERAIENFLRLHQRLKEFLREEAGNLTW
ncbi:MAG: LysR family transcriptional regulator [Nitrospinae bacterium]|nr:LysR family transcriptional regulator [Nitrospinota bacterium]